MTCIVGIKEKNKIILGGDCAISYGDRKLHKPDGKLVKKNGFIFGMAGSANIYSIIKHRFSPPLRTVGQSTDDYINIVFIDSLRKILEENHVVGKNTDHRPNLTLFDGSLIVGYENKLFYIGHYFSIIESEDDYICMGSGEEYAMGSLYSTKKIIKDSKKRISLAIQSAAHHTRSVSDKITFEHISF